MWRALMFAVIAAVLLASEAGAQAADSAPARPRHVFIILLENRGFDQAFKVGTDDPYLSRDLIKQGELLTNYYAIGHNSLDNYIALVSGQAPNVETQQDCSPNYTKFRPTGAALDGEGQVHGRGCVYPPAVLTIANQLEAKRLTWRGYMEDMEHPCDHPALDGPDFHVYAHGWHEQYATRHNPFVYFQAILENHANCAAHVVPLSRIDHDLSSVATTPNFAFITPNLCNDGHDGPPKRSLFCRDGHLKSADKFLRGFVPKILGSAAYKKDGMLIVTFDEAETTDGTSCCSEPHGPNVTQPAMDGPGDRSGGGHIGTLILSPYVKPGSTNASPYNHYNLLRGLEDIFGLDGYLGYARQATSFDGIFNQP